MKRILAALAFLSVALAARGQTGIPVHLDPDASSPRIGSLESPAMAVPAPWPEGSEAMPGWQPVSYRGAFEVYSHNNDIAKDLSVKPGRPYLLAPADDATVLALATDADRVDIVSVDTWYCKLRLETIVTGFVRQQQLSGPPAGAAPTANAASAPSASTAAQPKELVGKLLKVGKMEQLRVTHPYKLVGPAGKLIAYVDPTRVSSVVPIDDMVGQNVRVLGLLSESAADEQDYLIIAARDLKKAN